MIDGVRISIRNTDLRFWRVMIHVKKDDVEIAFQAYKDPSLSMAVDHALNLITVIAGAYLAKSVTDYIASRKEYQDG